MCNSKEGEVSFMVRQEGEIRRTPEERTVAFFQQKANELATQLTQGDGVVIALSGTDKRVRITEAQAYPEVGNRYRNIKDMNPGDLWNPAIRRGIRQSLIVTPKEREGACVRLLKVKYWDPINDIFVTDLTEGEENFGGREGDIAKYFGLERNERSRLQFLDESNRLYVVRAAYEVNTVNEDISPDDANRELERFLAQGST